MLKESNHLVFQQTITHRYPYDWRAKTPVIFRVTPQWFINTAQLTRDGVILEQLKNTKMVPSSSIARLSSMIQSRPDWCISRQRAWGIPIPVVYRLCDGKKTVIQSETNIDHIISLLDKNGTDYWFGDAPERPSRSRLPALSRYPGRLVRQRMLLVRQLPQQNRRPVESRLLVNR